jgi:hypothetical protein
LFFFRKLGRLALGLKRSDIDKLSSDSFTDFVAEFSQISNWTLGQVFTYKLQFVASVGSIYVTTPTSSTSSGIKSSSKIKYIRDFVPGLDSTIFSDLSRRRQ